MSDNEICAEIYSNTDYERPKEIFKFIGNIIEKNLRNKSNLSLLDVGCAKGEFLYYVSTRFSTYEPYICGVDFSRTLTDLARQFRGLQPADFYNDEADHFCINRKFDFIVATGLISFFDDYTQLLDNFINHLNDDGVIILTNGFSETDYDVIIRYRHFGSKGDLNPGWNQHSLQGLTNYFAARGKKLTAHKFNLPFPLERTEDPLRSWTLEASDGQKFVCGLNMIWNLLSLEVK